MLHHLLKLNRPTMQEVHPSPADQQPDYGSTSTLIKWIHRDKSSLYMALEDPGPTKDVPTLGLWNGLI